MANYRTSRIIPVALVLIIIVIAIAALVSLARVVFFSGPSTSTERIDTSRTALLTTSAGHSVEMSVRGPIVANEAFRSYQVAISPNKREITTYVGYLDTVVENKRLGNNVAAYEQFVYALDEANLAKGAQLEGDENDVRGVCATGDVYEFRIIEDNETVKHLWTTTCRGITGSLDAKIIQLSDLFTDQIPDANKLIDNVDL